MKAQGMLAVGATTLALLTGVDIAAAQPLPPLYGPPAYEALGAYPSMPPRYIRGAPVPPYDDALLPQEVAGILQSTGYDLLGAPLRRGRFYVVAASNPDGVGGRATIDAFSGRFMGFAPAAPERGAPQTPLAATAPGAAPPRGLRPPGSVPRVASTAPVPAPRPAQHAAHETGASPNSPAPAASTPAVAAPNVTTANATTAQAAPAAAPKLVDPKPAVQLRPTEPLPPVQPLE